ncbi:hypothetical protein NIES3974_47720 [Calothrix sp. NIES-3974]|nr:hypothetical protein NIES3974_47720 [Calothrix sp. NIES-3974]
MNKLAKIDIYPDIGHAMLYLITIKSRIHKNKFDICYILSQQIDGRSKNKHSCQKRNTNCTAFEV